MKMRFTRITVNPKQKEGVGMAGDGMTAEEIENDFPDLETEDVQEVLRCAAAAVRERELPLAAVS